MAGEGRGGWWSLCAPGPLLAPLLLLLLLLLLIVLLLVLLPLVLVERRRDFGLLPPEAVEAEEGAALALGLV